jgi:hypothetical protein
VSGKTAKLLRKAADGDPAKYKQVKILYNSLPRNMRHTAKGKAGDLAEVHRQQREISNAQKEN